MSDCSTDEEIGSVRASMEKYLGGMDKPPDYDDTLSMLSSDIWHLGIFNGIQMLPT